MKRFLSRLINRFQTGSLLVMRLEDMHRVHPQQITAKCSRCGHDVGVYPSGQQALREMPRLRLVCHVCELPGLGAQLAPGADQEWMQSRRKT